MEDLSKHNAEGTLLRKVQKRELEILDVVDAICKKHGLRYWLCSGTLLGAVRHQGFIPWDDDLDISMMRDEYKKLKQILRKELPDYLYLRTESTRYYIPPFSKVLDSRTEIKETWIQPKYPPKNGIYIDIIPYENAFPKLRKIINFFYQRSHTRIKIGVPFRSLKTLLIYTAALLMYLPSFLAVCSARLLCKLFPPKTVARPYGWHFEGIQNIDEIFPLTEVTFEGKKYPAPHNYDQYLRNFYGDYMKLPPEEEREIHLMEGTVKFFDE